MVIADSQPTLEACSAYARHWAMMTNVLTIRNIACAKVDELVTRAAHEGWNPGLHDAERFWRTDAENNPAALRLVQQ